MWPERARKTFALPSGLVPFNPKMSVTIQSKTEIRPASTVVLTRPSADGFEVFMVKRHRKSAFMPSVHVFPGGRVEQGDRALGEMISPASKKRIEAQSEEASKSVDVLGNDAAFLVAAIRETAEECGVLLARYASGRSPQPETAEAVFEELRGGAAFGALLESYRLSPDVDALRPFGWWITPDFEPRRYDTRFFMAEAPGGHRATFDAIETTDGAWLSPKRALSLFSDHTIALAPPTMATLEILAAASDPASALASVPRPIRPIRPHLIRCEDGEKLLVLPGDELYPTGEVRALPVRTRFEVLGEGLFI